MSEAPLRQAIVVIHGMGSQRPMRFLRQFVRTILPADVKNRFYSEPDLGDDSFELRRMHIVRRSDSSRPDTFVYEYYWAHLMKGSRLRHVLPLARRFLLRSPADVRMSLRFLWAALWLIIAVLAVRLLRFAAAGGELPDGLDGLLATFGWPQWVTAALGVVFAGLYGVLVFSFGDVARYLDAHPDNVEVRREIRDGAVRLLRRLHDEGYDRIVVVGHSLGSFVALDAISFVWNDLFRAHQPFTSRRDADAALRAAEQAGERLTTEHDADSVEAWQAQQRELWLERTHLGSPWRVSDLLTFGSPLHHGAMLLGQRKLPVEELQRLHELPMCPPYVEERDRARGTPYSYVPREHRKPPKDMLAVPRLHNAAQFACTRWTNVWFPSVLGVFGDWFGGPLADLFGPGVRDVRVTKGRWWRFVPVLPHGRYFKSKDERDVAPGTSGGILCHALELDSGEWLARMHRGVAGEALRREDAPPEDIAPAPA